MPLGRNALRRRRTTLICSAFLVLLALPDAQAKTSRHRRRAAFSVTLQPFSLVHSVVHTVAVPVVSTAPIKVAYFKQRRIRPRVPRWERVDDYEQEGERIHRASQPIRVAYQIERPAPALEPRADSEDDYDQERDTESNQQIERRGDRPMVAGKHAVLRNGIAYAPARAPQNVKNAIWAANTLRRKPYVWGGGHASFYDNGYDCSGSVSFALHGAGLLPTPMPSGDLMRYGERGRGRWITIYSRPGHTFAIIAGLRLDTTDLGRGGDVGPRWYVDGRDTGSYVARHPAGL